jgi:hypothetical protein
MCFNSVKKHVNSCMLHDDAGVITFIDKAAQEVFLCYHFTLIACTYV